MSTLIKIFKKNWIEKIFYILLASPALFILVNKHPYFLLLSSLIVLFLGLIFFLHTKKITSYHYPLLLLLVLIYAYFIISYFFSGQYFLNFFSYSFFRTDGNFFYCYILFFALAVPFFDYKKVLEYYFKFLFFIFSIFSFIGIIEFISGYSGFMIEIDPAQAGKMFMGLNNAHNATGSVYALVSILVLVFLLEEKHVKIKVVYSLVFLLCVTGLFLSKSRGSYIAFAGTMIFVLWIHFKSIKKFFLTLTAFTVIAIPILWLTHAIERLIQIFQVEGTAAVRMILWEKAWSLFSKSPIFGIGFGRFNDITSIFHENLAGYEGFLSVFLHPRFYYGFNHAHNSYLQFLSETGVLGLCLLILFWTLCFQIIFRSYKLSKDGCSKKYFLSGIASIVILFLLSFTENYFSATTIMIPVSMLVSLSIGLSWQEFKLLSKKIIPVDETKKLIM